MTYLKPMAQYTRFPGPRYLTMAAFMLDLSYNGHGLLGRTGFFDQFSFVKFKDFESSVEIGKLRR